MTKRTAKIIGVLLIILSILISCFTPPLLPGKESGPHDDWPKEKIISIYQSKLQREEYVGKVFAISNLISGIILVFGISLVIIGFIGIKTPSKDSEIDLPEQP